MMSPDEVDTDDRKLHSCQEESPLEAAAIQDELDRLVTPTSYGEAIRSNQSRDQTAVLMSGVAGC